VQLHSLPCHTTQLLTVCLQALLPSVALHQKLQLLQLAGCQLTDNSVTRIAAVLKAQSWTAAQQAWAASLRGGGSASRAQQPWQLHPHVEQVLLGADVPVKCTAEQAVTTGIQVLDLSYNQVWAAACCGLVKSRNRQR